MASMDNFRERCEALEQQTVQLKHQSQAREAHTRRVEQRLRWWRGIACGVMLLVPALVLPAAITEFDSTQPRGAPTGVVNDQGQVTDPIVEGFRAPARFPAPGAGLPGSGDPFYQDWLGSMMAYSIRDPSFFATLNVANQDFINFLNSLPGDPMDASTTLGEVLQDLKLHREISRVNGRLQPEELLPVTADFCLRCHAPVGWLEAHSEPPSDAFPFLQGQFWGAAFLEEPVSTPVDLSKHSEGEMEGISCDFCHRANRDHRLQSLFDGSRRAAGNGGFFVSRTNPFGGPDGVPRPVFDFQEKADFCGACHDVTNPLIKTKTEVNGVVPDMLHPLERTFTEWYWSAFRQERQQCSNCHEPMKFQGAQTWMLYPGMDRLWGNIDQKWVARGYNVSPVRTAALQKAARANRQFMAAKAASVALVELPPNVSPGQALTVKVQVTNLTGHKLPTGFVEGRQMWIHIRAVDGAGTLVFEDGVLNSAGYLVRTPETKVYEQEVLAEGYDFLPPGDEHFRFVLANKIVKDNRIPPRGYNKAAYQADGAFIIPHDPKDTDYAPGQYWDVTPYTIQVPAAAVGPINITATLYYQTFNREYIEFLKSHDQEKTQAHGGRARNLPTTGQYGHHKTWGAALFQLWEEAGKGPQVTVGTARAAIPVP